MIYYAIFCITSIKHLFKQEKNCISAAKLSWNDNGEPTSVEFNDIYFNTADGLDETTYVFIEQNEVHQRWLQTKSASYVIAETGFGSGLNFLVTWQHFEHFRAQNPNHPLKRLYFISFEKYPLIQSDLVKSHQRWTSLSNQATALQRQYPPSLAGCHRMPFALDDDNSQIILDLWFGDIKDTIIQVSTPPIGIVDSWYLDGFAPSKNPEMWNQDLYNNMAKLSKHNASMATFTAAGDVRRGLQQAGFVIKKAKGFGKKREMITGLFERTDKYTNHNPWLYRQGLTQLPVSNEGASTKSHITIVGGGVASAALALALAKRGINSEILCKDQSLACGASGNRQGGFYPLINGQHDLLSQFYAPAFLYAANHYHEIIQRNPEGGQLCGVLSLDHEEKQAKAHRKVIDSALFPKELVEQLTAEQASTLSGIAIEHNALHFPTGGWVSPKSLTSELIKLAQQHSDVTVRTNCQVESINFVEDNWQINVTDQSTLKADILVLACGHEIANFAQCQHLPFYATAGQVSHLDSTETSEKLNKVLCYQGYVTPSNNGSHCVGASFNRDISSYDVNDTEHQQNLEKLETDVPALFTEINNNVNGGKVGVRCSVKDHLPMVGNVPDYNATKALYDDLHKGKPAHHYENSPIESQLFMLGGLGSRGLCSAPLLAEVLTCQLTDEPMPLPQPLLDQLNPNRYWIKQLKKHNVDI